MSPVSSFFGDLAGSEHVPENLIGPSSMVTAVAGLTHQSAGSGLARFMLSSTFILSLFLCPDLYLPHQKISHVVLILFFTHYLSNIHSFTGQ